MIVARKIPTSDFKKQVSNEYFHWLCDQVEMNDSNYSHYFLAQDLYAKKFYSIIPNDDNRAMDGIALRQRFYEEVGYSDNEILDGPCSILELFLALAERIDGIMADITNTNKTIKWFWELLMNLRLNEFDDDSYYDRNGKNEVERILNVFLSRTYKRDGKGGLFPLFKPVKDQRKVEIWYQMNQYLLENYV